MLLLSLYSVLYIYIYITKKSVFVRDILVVVCVMKFKLLTKRFLKEKIQKRKISSLSVCQFFLFFLLLLALARKVFIYNSHFSLSLSLYYIYIQTLNDKKKE